jgi:predicted component of type VI protein secretion system
VRDALLSRQHCRLAPVGSTWVLTDLNSRNGTFLPDGERITQHVLEEGDVIRIGRVRLCFRAGPFVAAPTKTTYSKMMRPSDPVEALAGTVMGFVLNESDMEEESRVSGFPIPKPQPAEPAAYKRDQVHAMVAHMASRSWDAKAKSGETRQVARPLPQPMVKPTKPATKSAPVAAARRAQTSAAPAKGSTAAIAESKLASEAVRPFKRVCAWIAIGAAVAIYVTAMCVIVQA